jgi:hypothetical protein
MEKIGIKLTMGFTWNLIGEIYETLSTRVTREDAHQFSLSSYVLCICRENKRDPE